MASSLTASGLKSGVLYLLLLAFIISGVFYLFLFDKPSIHENLKRRAFMLNASAFENGIYLAKIRFLAGNPNRNQIDQWQEGNIGLDYNRYGFPIGTSVTNPSQLQVTSKQNCQQIWQFVLGPLQPELDLQQHIDSYWVELDTNKQCLIRFGKIENMLISYQSFSGKVRFTD